MTTVRRLIKIKLHITLLVTATIWTTALATKSIVDEHAVDLFWTMLSVSGFLLFAIIAVLQWVIISFMRDIKLEIKHVRAEYGLRIHGAELAIEALRTRQEVESGVDR